MTKMKTFYRLFLIALLGLFFVQTSCLASKNNHLKRLASSNNADTLKIALIHEIENIIKDFGYPLGLAFKDLKNNDTIFHNEIDIFPTASAIKIEILIHLMKEYEKNELNLFKNIPVKFKVGGSGILQYFDLTELNLSYFNLAVLMIQQSDNTATNILIEKLGIENINKTIQELGLKNTKLQRLMMDFEAREKGIENLSSPLDKLLLLEKIYFNKILNDSLTHETIKILSIPKTSPLISDLNEELTLASKGGELNDVRCDMGIFYCGNFDYILVVMTKNLPNSELGENVIKKLSKVFFDYMKIRYDN